VGDEQKDEGAEFEKTAVFFLAPDKQQKLEVNYNRGFFKQNYQIVLDGVCLESGLSEAELERGKTYPLPDGMSLEVKFLGNQVVVWQDGQRILLDHEKYSRQIDPWQSVTFAMYGGGIAGLVAGVSQLFPIAEIDPLRAEFWLNTVSFFVLGAMLLLCGYVARRQQKLWALWGGNALLTVLFVVWFTYTFWIDRENFRFTRIFYAAMFIWLAVEQVKNTKKAQATLAPPNE